MAFRMVFAERAGLDLHFVTVSSTVDPYFYSGDATIRFWLTEGQNRTAVEELLHGTDLQARRSETVAHPSIS